MGIKFGKGRLEQLTDEQIAGMKRQARQLKHDWETKPSSPEGRRIWWSRVGVLSFPFVVLDAVLIWLRGDEVWYSDSGVRFVRHSVRRG